MNVLQCLHPLKAAIIDIVLKHQTTTMQELHDAFICSDIKVSKPNLYKLVASLVCDQVLSREKGNITINTSWIPHLQDFVQRLQTWQALAQIYKELPALGETIH